MPVIVMFTADGFTKANYESLRKEVGWETQLASGGLVHTCGFDAKGEIHVTDVWASEEQLNAFVETRLMPAIKKLGAPAPTATLVPLHNLNLHPDSKPYLLG